MAMLQTLANIFRVPELRNKVLFTLMMLAIYRIGFHIPLPGVDQTNFQKIAQQQAKGQDQGAASRMANYISLFSGGSLQQSSIFGLGVMPYISASIIFQLLGTVVPSLEKLQKEGQTGQRKIQEWTRYATIPLCVVQGIFWIGYMHGANLVQANLAHSFSFWASSVLSLTAGSIFLMWLGEQIDEYGLGNGISLLILAGIVARMPAAISQLFSMVGFRANEQAGVKPLNLGHVFFLVFSFVFIVAGSILITQAQRRIKIQQAKHVQGRRVYGGQSQALPLRVNHGGVMPIIFAQSLMLFPGIMFDYLSQWFPRIGFFGFLHAQFQGGSYIYVLTETIMIYFFAYFWTTVQFQPKEMANQLRDYGSFIPGLRPGKRTADYLERVMMRITYVGAAFLCVIAIIPTAINLWLGIPFGITAFLGGTGLLIVVSVALDMVQRIEANLLMRNYGGFLGSDGSKGRRIKGRQY